MVGAFQGRKEIVQHPNPIFRKEVGLQIRRYEATHEKNSLIIAVTGYFRHEKDHLISTDHVAKNLGADFTLEKPINILNILSIIGNAG